MKLSLIVITLQRVWFFLKIVYRPWDDVDNSDGFLISPSLAWELSKILYVDG